MKKPPYETTRTVRNCADAFAFVCPQQWDAMDATDDDDIHFCRSCEKNVYFCRTDEETVAHAKAGHCVARALPVVERQTPVMIGRVEPEPAEMLAKHYRRREETIAEVLKVQTSKSCDKCGYPMRDDGRWCDVCRVT